MTDRTTSPADTAGLTALAGALALMPPRFHLGLEPGPGAVSLASLHDPANAVALMDRHLQQRGLDTVAWSKPSLPGQIAASLTVQGIAMHLLGSVLAGTLLHGMLLRAKAEDIHLDAIGPAFTVAITDAVVEVADRRAAPVDAFAEHWLDGHMRRLVDDLRAGRRVGEALLWGNVASAVAATFVFLDWWEPGCDAAALAAALLATGHPPLRDHAGLATVSVRGRTGLRSERRACCLLAKVPGGHLCPTCPLSSEAERIATTAQHVEHLFAVRSGEAAGPPPWAGPPN